MIAFRKLYSEPVEGEMLNSIVAYRSRAFTYGDEYDEVIKTIWIDFWLFVVRFSWVKKKPPTRSQKIYGQMSKKESDNGFR